MVETKQICPLNCTCKEIKDDVMVICNWLITVKGTDAQGVEHDDEKCAMAWLPTLLLESASEARKANKNIQDMKTETVIRQEQALNELQNMTLGLTNGV